MKVSFGKKKKEVKVKVEIKGAERFKLELKGVLPDVLDVVIKNLEEYRNLKKKG